MNKTKIIAIVNEPSKHIQIVKIDGKDHIVYSADFVELLELIPTMLTNADIVDMLEDLKKEMNPIKECEQQVYGKESWNFAGKCQNIIQQKIDCRIRQPPNG